MIKKDRLLDRQRINLYSYVRNDPLKYIDPTGADLVLAANLKAKQREFIVNNLARLYMTEKGRAALERADRSPYNVVVGRGTLERTEINPARLGEFKIGGTVHVVGGITTYDTATDTKTKEKYLMAGGPPGLDALNPIRVAIDKDNSSDMGKDPARVLQHEIAGHVNSALDLAERPYSGTDYPEGRITGLDPKKDEENAQRVEKELGKLPDKPSPEAIKAVEELLKPRKKDQ